MHSWCSYQLIIVGLDKCNQFPATYISLPLYICIHCHTKLKCFPRNLNQQIKLFVALPSSHSQRGGGCGLDRACSEDSQTPRKTRRKERKPRWIYTSRTGPSQKLCCPVSPARHRYQEFARPRDTRSPFRRSSKRDGVPPVGSNNHLPGWIFISTTLLYCLTNVNINPIFIQIYHLSSWSYKGNNHIPSTSVWWQQCSDFELMLRKCPEVKPSRSAKLPEGKCRCQDQREINCWRKSM